MSRKERTIFVDSKEGYVDYAAPVIAVVLGERGYYPIHTAKKATDLNGGVVPYAVTQAAIAGSMFGWDCPAAADAVRWFRVEREQFIA